MEEWKNGIGRIGYPPPAKPLSFHILETEFFRQNSVSGESEARLLFLNMLTASAFMKGDLF